MGVLSRVRRGEQSYYLTRFLGATTGYLLYVSGLFVLFRTRYANYRYVQRRIVSGINFREDTWEFILQSMNIDLTAPLWRQYLVFVWRAFTGDLGADFTSMSDVVIHWSVPWAALLGVGTLLATRYTVRRTADGAETESRDESVSDRTLCKYYVRWFAGLLALLVTVSAVLRIVLSPPRYLYTPYDAIGFYLYRLGRYTLSLGQVPDAGLLLGVLLLLGLTFFAGLSLTLAGSHWLRTHDHRPSLGTALSDR